MVIRYKVKLFEKLVKEEIVVTKEVRLEMR
jgi:hypothetical protein